MAEAAAVSHQVDRSTIVQIRTVAKGGVGGAVSIETRGSRRAVKLIVVEGKAVGARWPAPGSVDVVPGAAVHTANLGQIG